MTLVNIASGPYVLYRANNIVDSPPGGNADGRLDPGESADLVVALRNVGRVGVSGLTGRLHTSDQYVTVLDSLGAFGDVEPDSVRSNDADRFRVQAASATPKEHPVEFTLHLSGTDFLDSVKFAIRVSEMRATDPIPDGPRQPALYWAYDDADSGCSQRPTYSWVEIKTLGTRLNFANNDAVIVVNLPPEFGPFNYYGQRYTQLSVSADGWIAPGSYTTGNYINTGLPSASAPPGAICAGWDDLNPGYGSTGYAYYYHDEANHRFVVEFDSVAYYDQTSARDKFEFIFYDTTLASPSGNSVFEFQYMTANRFSSNTVGIQDPGKTIGIQCLYDASHHVGCWPLEAQRVIRFAADPPTGVTEEGPRPQASRLALTVCPNPVYRGAFVHYFSACGGPVELCAFDAAGREAGCWQFSAEKGGGRYFWQPRNLVSGIYFLKLRTPEEESVAKVMLLD